MAPKMIRVDAEVYAVIFQVKAKLEQVSGSRVTMSDALKHILTKASK